MKIVDCIQGTDEWKAARAGIATASSFDAVMAKIASGEAATRRNYRVRLVVERLTGRPLEGGFTSAAIRQGHEREPDARAAYETHTKRFVSEVGLCLHDRLECAASPDGLVGDDGGVEIKCPELSAHLDYFNRKDEPPEYRPQIQGNLWITGRAWWDFVSFNPDFPEHMQLVIRRVYPNLDYQVQLAAEVDRFMCEVRAEVAKLREMGKAA